MRLEATKGQFSGSAGEHVTEQLCVFIIMLHGHGAVKKDKVGGWYEVSLRGGGV